MNSERTVSNNGNAINNPPNNERRTSVLLAVKDAILNKLNIDQ
jgi:hypothetical protein